MDFDFRVRKWPGGLYIPAKLLRSDNGQWPDDWENTFQRLIQEVWDRHVDQAEQHGFRSLWELMKALKLRIKTFEGDAETLEGQITFFQTMRQCVLNRRAKHGRDTALAESFPFENDHADAEPEGPPELAARSQSRIFHDEGERWGWERTSRRSTVAMKPVEDKLNEIGATVEGISPDQARPTFDLTSTWGDVFDSVKNQHEPYERQLDEVTYTLDVLRFRLSIIDAISYRFETSGDVYPLSDTEANEAVKTTVLGRELRDEYLAAAILVIEQNPEIDNFSAFYEALDSVRNDRRWPSFPRSIKKTIRRGLQDTFGETWDRGFAPFKKRIMELYGQHKEILKDKMTLRDK